MNRIAKPERCRQCGQPAFVFATIHTGAGRDRRALCASCYARVEGIALDAVAESRTDDEDPGEK